MAERAFLVMRMKSRFRHMDIRPMASGTGAVGGVFRVTISVSRPR